MNIVAASSRSIRGHILLERTPFLVVLSAILVLPTVDLLALGYDYTSCFTLNDLQTQQASTLPADQAEDPAGLIRKDIPENWRENGLGALVPLTMAPQTEVQFADEMSVTGKNFNSSRQFVVVRTKVQTQPVVKLPLSISVPGFSCPITFDLSNRHVLSSRHCARSCARAPSAG